MKIAVIDYGIGNVKSVVNACERRSSTVQRVVNGDELARYQPDKVILPGVGAIGAALGLVRERGFEGVLREMVLEGSTSYLGICVGMQMLAEDCEEFGRHRGLGWIGGVARRLPDGDGVRIPHIGWNSITVTAAAGGLLAPADGKDFYFVHSYHLDCDQPAIAATTSYGTDFVSAVRFGNVTGVQFHPEKSAEEGLRLIGRFLEETPC